MGRFLLAEQGGRDRPKSAALLDDHLDRDLSLAESLNLTLEAFYALPDDEQEWWRIRRARETCPTCKGPREDCSDGHRAYYPQRSVCYLTMAAAGARGKWERLHEDKPYHDGTFTSWAEKASDQHPYHRDDGVQIWVAPVDLNPDDDFLADGGGMPWG